MSGSTQKVGKNGKPIQRKQPRRLCKEGGIESSEEKKIGAHVVKDGGAESSDVKPAEPPATPGNGSSSNPEERLPFSGTGIEKMRKVKFAKNRYLKKNVTIGTATTPKIVTPNSNSHNEAAGKEPQPSTSKRHPSKFVKLARDIVTKSSLKNRLVKKRRKKRMDRTIVTRALTKQILEKEPGDNPPPAASQGEEIHFETNSADENKPPEIVEINAMEQGILIKEIGKLVKQINKIKKGYAKSQKQLSKMQRLINKCKRRYQI